MRRARIYVHGVLAGVLMEQAPGTDYVFRYEDNYHGPPVSLSLPLAQREYRFEGFPAFFEGLLPEGDMLEGLPWAETRWVRSP
jgi:serine/threonine-protein kinase HipA